MSRATDLLEAATPLPWKRSGPGPEPDGDQIWLVGDGNRAQFIAWTDASLPAITDFDLMAYAVNRLPDYEAAVEALERLVRQFDAFDKRTRLPILDVEIDEARVALARLREKVPA